MEYTSENMVAMIQIQSTPSPLPATLYIPKEQCIQIFQEIV